MWNGIYPLNSHSGNTQVTHIFVTTVPGFAALWLRGAMAPQDVSGQSPRHVASQRPSQFESMGPLALDVGRRCAGDLTDRLYDEGVAERACGRTLAAPGPVGSCGNLAALLAQTDLNQPP